MKLEDVRHKNMHVLQKYVDELYPDGKRYSFAYRFYNRLCRADELFSNNPLKKILYRQHLKRIVQQAEEQSGVIFHSLAAYRQNGDV